MCLFQARLININLKNAHDLEKKSAVIVIKEADFSKEKLEDVLEGLKSHPHRIKELSTCIHKLNLGAAADSIASYLLQR